MQGSWKQALRNSFKNFRRDNPERLGSEQSGASPCSRSPPEQSTSKRRRIDDSYDTEYVEDDVLELSVEWKKGRKKRNMATIKNLLEKTRGYRQKWICEERPLIYQVLSKFPLLNDSKMVRDCIFATKIHSYLILATERVCCCC